MIEVKHLRTLQVLKLSGSLAAAADRLYQTHSALSHQFLNLEQRLGFRLFVRKSQPLRFTPQGEILLSLAESILPQIQQALQNCLIPQQNLCIAIDYYSGIPWLLSALMPCHQQWPQLKIEMKPGVMLSAQQALLRRQLDIVLTADILPQSGLQYIPLFDFEVRLVLSARHPLARANSISAADLADDIVMPATSLQQRPAILKHFFQPAGIMPTLKQIDNMLLLIHRVSAGKGISALPHWITCTFERQALIVTRSAGKGVWSRLYAAIRQGEQQRMAINTFVHAVRQHAEATLPFVRRLTPGED